MTEKKSAQQAYNEAASHGAYDPDNPVASAQGQIEFQKKQAAYREAAQESVTKHFSPESQRAYEQLGQAIAKVLWPIFVWSAFGMGVYFAMHALAKVFGMGESSAVFPYYTSINGFFAIGVFVPMVFGLYKLYKKSSKRFWQVNLSLVAVSFAILLI